MRIVADTNTLVSGFGWGGPPSRIVDAVLDGRVTIVITSPLLAELGRVLRYQKLARVFPQPQPILDLLASVAELVEPANRVSVLADQPDNRLLEAATAGHADAIVSGDAAVLALRTFEGIPIVTAHHLAAHLDQDP